MITAIQKSLGYNNHSVSIFAFGGDSTQRADTNQPNHQPNPTKIIHHLSFSFNVDEIYRIKKEWVIEGKKNNSIDVQWRLTIEGAKSSTHDRGGSRFIFWQKEKARQ